MGITTHSKNPEAAKAFVEWFYSDAWYPGYINFVTSASSMTNFPKEKDPHFWQKRMPHSRIWN